MRGGREGAALTVATWEVEVTKTDGRTVDVRLDEAFELVIVEGDTEDADGG